MDCMKHSKAPGVGDLYADLERKNIVLILSRPYKKSPFPGIDPEATYFNVYRWHTVFGCWRCDVVSCFFISAYLQRVV
jgi:hypothetical protein